MFLRPAPKPVLLPKSKQEIRIRTEAVLSTLYEEVAEALPLDTSIAEHYDLDSLDLAEAVLSLEEEFVVGLDEDCLKRNTTLNELVERLAEKMGVTDA